MSIETGEGRRRARIRRAGRAVPARAAAALLPHARVAAGRRGPGPGDAARRLAEPRRLRGACVAARVALPDRDEPLPQRPTRPRAPPRGGGIHGTVTNPLCRADVARALPGQRASRPAPGPEARYEQREATQLAFIAGLQQLPERQRAALVLRDVLGFRNDEVAAMLDLTRSRSRLRCSARGRRSTSGSRSSRARRCRTRRPSARWSHASATPSSRATPRVSWRCSPIRRG